MARIITTNRETGQQNIIYVDDDFVKHTKETIAEAEDLRKRISTAINFIDQVLQYHLSPFEYKQVDEDINTLIGILQGGSNE